MRRLRKAQGLSAQQVSDATAKLGAPMPRTVLSNLENGRRGNITVAEVLVLARVLKVPPATLIFPLGREERAEPLPDQWVEPSWAIDWLAGQSFFDDASREAAQHSPISLIRKHQRLTSSLSATISERDSARAEYARLDNALGPSAERYRMVRDLLREAIETRASLTEQVYSARRKVKDVLARKAMHEVEFNHVSQDRDPADREVKLAALRRKDSQRELERIEHELARVEQGLMHARHQEEELRTSEVASARDFQALAYLKEKVDRLEKEAIARGSEISALRHHLTSIGLKEPLLPSDVAEFLIFQQGADHSQAADKEND